MASPVIVGAATFRTKKAAKEFYTALRDRYADGTPIETEDEKRLRELLANHPEADSKAGVGVSHFSVQTDTVFGRTRHFVVHRVDGTSTDFSFLSCIDGRNEKRDRLEALRSGVEEQIVAFREKCFAQRNMLVCPLRGIPVTRTSYHIDHEPPLEFLILVEDWLRLERLALTDVRITPPADNQIVATMTDPVQLGSWQRHHQARARLRMLSPLGNLSDARRGK